MKKVFVLLIMLCFFFFGFVANSQNAITGANFGNNWNGGCGSDNSGFAFMSTSLGTSYTVTRNPSGTGNQYWRFGIDWGGTISQVTITPGSDVEVYPNTEYQLDLTCTTSGAMYTNVSSTSHNYVFKTSEAGSSPAGRFIFFKVEGTVRTVSTVSSPSIVLPGKNISIEATLDGAFSAGQSVYLRYTNDNFSTSTIIEMTGSGTSYSATIPSSINTASANISYYVFTSGGGMTISSTNADFYTINFNNNSGSNYSYTVQSAGRSGSGYSINFASASRQAIDLGTPSNLNFERTDAFSVETWFKSSNTNHQNIIGKMANSSPYKGYEVFTQTNSVRFFMVSNYTTPNYLYVYSSATVNDGNWHHIAVTYDGSSAPSGVKIYVDGVSKTVNTAQNSLSSSILNSENVYVSSRNNSAYFTNGVQDEFRVWSNVLTESQIREWMCRKLASSHSNYSNLITYLDFDENAGTQVFDSKNSNTGASINSPTFALSEAPFGDESAYSFGGGNSTSVTETHSDGSSFKIDGFTGTPDGAHVYLENEAPNSTTESLSGALDATRYYGTFVVGGTNPTHTVTYDYTGNTNISGGTEAEAVLASRGDNSVSSWDKLTNNYDLNTTTDGITQCNVADNKEYAGGFDTELQERPGSGYALEFDGTDDYVTIPNSTSTTPGTELTVEAWIKPDADQIGSIAMKGSYGWGFYLAGATGCSTGNQLNYWVDGSCANTISSTGTLTNGEWAHVAVVVTTSPSKTLAFYINGVAAGTSTSSAITIGNGSNGSIYVGRQGSVCSCSYFDGSMDELRVWNKALSQAEIQARMCKKINSTDANYCDLGSYLRYDENTGSTAYDYSGNSDGTLTNSPTYALSGAAIGDESVYSYGSGNSTTVTETHSDGSSFKIDGFTGTPDGAHVYLVNEASNSNTRSGFSGSLDETRYYGAFVVGGTSPSYTITYDYTDNTNITGGTEAEARLGERNDNSATTWTTISNNADLNQENNTITKGCYNATQKEFIAGFDNTEEFALEPSSGYALSFDGTDDYVAVTSPFTGFSNAITVEAWINLDDFNEGGDGIITMGTVNSNTSAENVFLVSDNGAQDGKITFYIGDGGTTLRSATSTTNFEGTGWHHFAGVANSSGTYVYVDENLRQQVQDCPLMLLQMDRQTYILAEMLGIVQEDRQM